MFVTMDNSKISFLRDCQYKYAYSAKYNTFIRLTVDDSERHALWDFLELTKVTPL